MDCYLTGQVADIQLVPISITYERTLEENLFAKELLGIPKPKESTRVGAADIVFHIPYGCNFCGVQIFMDFMLIHKKLLNFSYITK